MELIISSTLTYFSSYLDENEIVQYLQNYKGYGR